MFEVIIPVIVMVCVVAVIGGIVYGVILLSNYLIGRDSASTQYYFNTFSNKLEAWAYDKGYDSYNPKKNWGKVYTERRRNRRD